MSNQGNNIQVGNYNIETSSNDGSSNQEDISQDSADDSSWSSSGSHSSWDTKSESNTSTSLESQTGQISKSLASSRRLRNGLIALSVATFSCVSFSFLNLQIPISSFDKFFSNSSNKIRKDPTSERYPNKSSTFESNDNKNLLNTQTAQMWEGHVGHVFAATEINDKILKDYNEDGVVAIRGLVDKSLLQRLDSISMEMVETQALKRAGRKGTQFHTVKSSVLFENNLQCRSETQDCAVDDVPPFRKLALTSKVAQFASELLLSQRNSTSLLNETVRVVR